MKITLNKLIVKNFLQMWFALSYRITDTGILPSQHGLTCNTQKMKIDKAGTSKLFRSQPALSGLAVPGEGFARS